MSNCKSIRKCCEKTTASELGVEVGDKFVVLSPEQSYGGEHHYSELRVGDIVELCYDDNTDIPCFSRVSDGLRFYESFCCLTRYEESGAVAEPTPLPSTNATFIRRAEYQSAAAVEADWGEEGKCSLSSSKIIVEGLTPEQYISLINFINSMTK